MGILIRLSLFGHTWGYSLSSIEKQADSKYVYDYFFMFSTWFFEKNYHEKIIFHLALLVSEKVVHDLMSMYVRFTVRILQND